MKQNLNGEHELVTCPECQVLVRSDRLASHRASVHGVRKYTTRVEKTPPGKRLCPLCNKILPPEGYKKHLRNCMRRAKQNSNPKVNNRVNNPSRDISHKSYIIDEFGVVRNYSEWFEDETLAEHTEARPASAKKTTRPIEQKESRFTNIRDSDRETTPSKRPRVVTCYICGARVPVKDLKNHKIAHQNKPQQASKPRSTRYDFKHTTNMSSATISLNVLDKKTQENILKKYKSNRGDRAKQLAHIKASIDPTDKQLCPFCKQTFLAADLPKHIDQKHPAPRKTRSKKNFRYTNNSNQRNKTAASSDQTTGDKLIDVEDSHDGSKYLGHFKREGGKFGSYPMHDDYSDESDAD